MGWNREAAAPISVIGGFCTDAAAELQPGETFQYQSFFDEGWTDSIPDGSRSLDYYFKSYSHLGIHEEMLKDRVRTNSYYNAIMNNKHAFKGKIVLDIGAGTGVLSMFAAKAGAAHVYAVEYSDVANLARDLIAANKLDDKITVIQAKAEEAILPGVAFNSVDIIISEWMGYFLLYESMLDCVLQCRDKWLRPDGLILPDKCSMYIAGLEDGEYKQEKFEFWDNVYGLDYSIVRNTIIAEPLIDTVDEEKVITDACCIFEIDLRTIRLEDLDFVSRFKLTTKAKDYLHGLVAWFDCKFEYGLHKPLLFSTAPRAQYTHWKQTVFYTPLDAIAMNEGEVIRGLIAVRKGAVNPRTIDVKIQIVVDGQVSGSVDCTQLYHIR